MKRLEMQAFDPTRQQVNLEEFYEFALRDQRISRNRKTQKILMLEQDLFTPGRTNWCFGQYTHRQGIDLVVLSTKRVIESPHWHDLLAHEIGHMYGAASY